MQRQCGEWYNESWLIYDSGGAVREQGLSIDYLIGNICKAHGLFKQPSQMTIKSAVTLRPTLNAFY